MCLAKAYAGTDGALLVMENVTHVEIEGETLTLRSLFGDTQSLSCHISSIDFSEGRLILEATEGLGVVEAQHGATTRDR